MSGLIWTFSRLCACEKLLGYPSRSHPPSFASCRDKRDITIYEKNRQLLTYWRKKNRTPSKRKEASSTAVTISSGTRRPFSMYSFAFFPISVPDDTSALKRSPVDICTKPY